MRLGRLGSCKELEVGRLGSCKDVEVVPSGTLSAAAWLRVVRPGRRANALTMRQHSRSHLTDAAEDGNKLWTMPHQGLQSLPCAIPPCCEINHWPGPIEASTCTASAAECCRALLCLARDVVATHGKAALACPLGGHAWLDPR